MPAISFETFLSLAQSHGTSAALTQLQSSAPPPEVAATFDAFLREAYWKHKNIHLVAALAHAGIPFCQQHAANAQDIPTRNDFLATAKVLAYNFASFTWPGWDEPGIVLTPALIAEGLEAARLNLQLAHDLQKPADKIRNAHWLVGAQLLAAPHATHLEEALTHFELFLPPPLAPVPPDDQYQLARGYILLAHCLLHSPDAEIHWSDWLAELQTRADKTAPFAREQLLTARRTSRIDAAKYVAPRPFIS